MGIFGRFNRVVKSNLNSMLDRAEDPEKLITQTVVEMKSELKQARKELVSTLGMAKRLEKKAAELADEAIGWEDKAVLALQANDDDLAREALKQKGRIAREAEATERRSHEQANAADEMKETLEQIEAKIDDLEAKKSSLAAQVKRAREGSGSSRSFSSPHFDELDRMGNRIETLEAEIEAHEVLDDPKRADLEARFRKLERGVKVDAVDDELAALKRKLEG